MLFRSANSLAHDLPNAIQTVASKNPAAMAGATPEALAQLKNSTAVLKTLSPELRDGILHAFTHGFHYVFLSALPVTLLGLFVALFLRETPLKTGADHAAARDEAAGEALG